MLAPACAQLPWSEPRYVGVQDDWCLTAPELQIAARALQQEVLAIAVLRFVFVIWLSLLHHRRSDTLATDGRQVCSEMKSC